MGFVLCVAYLSRTLGVLPPQIPTHFGLARDSGATWLDRDVFVSATVVTLLALNGLLALGLYLLARGRGHEHLRVPWNRYWFASSRRRSEALNRLRDVTIMAGAVMNAVCLLGYHLVMQAIGRELWLEIPAEFGVYMILVSIVVFIYGTVNYFKPP